MKILYGITKSNFGGAQRYVYDLARESKHRGFETAVILGGAGTLKEKLESRDVRVIEIPGFGRNMDLLHDAPRLWFIVRSVWREKPDIFHINSAKMGGAGIFTAAVLNLYAALTGNKHRIKVIFTAHGWAFNGTSRPGWQNALIKFFSWLTVIASDRTICVSEKMKNDMASWPFVAKRLVIVRNGIMPFDLLTREEARKELGIKEETYVVGTIAELHRVKGLDILLTAWADFSKNRNVTLVIIGDGEEGENLNVLAQKLGIAESVYFAGFVDNARKFLRAFDVFVLASRSEAMPYAPIEAGFASLPVVATAVGGVPEIIREDETGLLIQPEYPEELRHVLDGLRRDGALRKRLGDNLHHLVETDFNMRTMFDQTFDLYI